MDVGDDIYECTLNTITDEIKYSIKTLIKNTKVANTEFTGNVTNFYDEFLGFLVTINKDKSAFDNLNQLLSIINTVFSLIITLDYSDIYPLLTKLGYTNPQNFIKDFKGGFISIELFYANIFIFLVAILYIIFSKNSGELKMVASILLLSLVSVDLTVIINTKSRRKILLKNIAKIATKKYFNKYITQMINGE